jgi:hypothetical protein
MKYLHRVLYSNESHFLPENTKIAEFINQINKKKNTYLFSDLFITDTTTTLNPMEQNKYENDAFQVIHNEIVCDTNDSKINVVYPLLDNLWVQYYMSINLSYKKHLIMNSFSNFEFNGLIGLFTLDASQHYS